MKNLLLASLLLLPCGQARADFSSGSVGTAAAQFLKLGADARSAGMGQAVRAVADDATAVYWNPAGLAALQTHDVSLTHGAYYQSVFYDYLAYAQPISSVAPDRRLRELQGGDYGALGFSALYLNAGKITELDNTGAPTGDTFTPQDLAVSAGWGLALNDTIDIGLAGKYISSKIRDTASTGAFDFGTRLHFWFGDMPYVLSASVLNLGGRIKYIEQSDPIPLTLSVGNALHPTRNWVLALDVVAPNDGAPYPAFGTEFRVPMGSSFSAALRMGYNGRTAGSALDGLTGLTVGAGLDFSRVAFDYGWAPYGVLGDAQRLSFSYRF